MRIRSDCRLCGGLDLTTVLELQPTPPANEFVKQGAEEQDRFQLYLARCESCGHVQLPVVVDPERLFRNYVYVSGTSSSFVRHFERYAEQAVRFNGMAAGDLVVDIGSNDGTLLNAFKSHGMRVLGVDPAREIAERATRGGVETWPEFFNRDVARRIVETHGRARFVTANNVFAHADDLAEIALGVKELLDPEHGRFVFEVQYLVDLVDKTLFDMVYHEHLSYHSLGPLVAFFNRLGMTLVDAERVDTHGGSIRCQVLPRRSVATRRVDELVAMESIALAPGKYIGLRERIRHVGAQMRAWLDEQRSQFHRVAGFGAPAKLTTLAHEFGITSRDIAYVVDDSPWKQGLLTPGTRIPVVSSEHLAKQPPDRIVIFAWNFAGQIAAKHPAFKGRFVTPLPEFKEL